MSDIETNEIKSYKNLFDFLQDHKYDKAKHGDGGPTHTRIGDHKKIHGGSYYIPDNEYDTMML